MPDNIKNYAIESYAVFINVDESILLTNSFLERFGYKFTKLSIKELEQNFSSLFSLPTEIESKSRMHINEIDVVVSGEFYNAFDKSLFFPPHSINLKYEFYLLKSLNDFNLEIVNNIIDPKNSWGENVNTFSVFFNNICGDSCLILNF